MQHELLGQLNQFVLPAMGKEGAEPSSAAIASDGGLARPRDVDSPDDLGLGPAKRQKPM